MEKKKNHALTYLKAVGIITMVVVHGMCPIHVVTSFIHMLSMPIFFFASGYCFKAKYLDNPKPFFIGRLKRLYLPYVKWGLIFLLLPNILDRMDLLGTGALYYTFKASIYSWPEILDNARLIVTQMRYCEQILIGYWFLNALLVGTFLSWLLIKGFQVTSKHIKGLQDRPWIYLLTAFIILAAVDFTDFHILVLNINTRALIAAFIFVAGYYAAQTKQKLFGWKAVVVSVIITLLVARYSLIILAMEDFDKWAVLPYTLASVLIVWSIYSVLYRWKDTDNIVTRVLKFFGDNTFTVLTWHAVAFKPVTWLIIRLYGLPMERMGDIPAMGDYASKGWWVLYLFASLTICCCIAYLSSWFKVKGLKSKVS